MVVKKINIVSLVISLAFALMLAFLSNKGTPLLNLSNNLFLIGLFILIIALILYLYDAHLFRHLFFRHHQTDDDNESVATDQPVFYTELRRSFLWIGLGEIVASIVISFL